VLAIAPPVPAHGGYAPRINVEAARLHRVPDHVPMEVAAQIEPATVALHGVRRTTIHTGDTVVVTGAGEIGLVAMQLAALAGAQVIVVEPNEHRRAMAMSLGTRAVASADDVTEKADVVLECAGSVAAVEAGLRLLRMGGQITLIGVAHGTLTIDPDLWLIREATIRTSLAHNAWDFDASIRLIADGHLELAPLAQRTVTLDELPGTFEQLADGTANAVKVLVDPTTP
jgi:2-desacetyl-2-hydroxyethyl bacteriochlorophyllide A dehydrogenase